MNGKIVIRKDGSGHIASGGVSDRFERIGADAANQIGFDYSKPKRLRVEVDDAERYSIHGDCLNYD